MVVHRLVDIAVVNHTEGEIESRRHHPGTSCLSEHITDIRHESRQQHRVLLTETDIDRAYRHQQTGNRLCWLIPPLILCRGLRHDTEFHLHGVEVLDDDLIRIDHLVLDRVRLAVFRAGCDNQSLRTFVMSHGDGGVRLQCYLALIAVLVLGQYLFFRIVRCLGIRFLWLAGFLGCG